jgi:hypothetical protein
MSRIKEPVHQPTIPPMPEKHKPRTEREFITEVLTLASIYNFNCYVKTDNASGSINCNDRNRQFNFEKTNTTELFEPERTEYIRGMEKYLNELKENNKTNTKNDSFTTKQQ